MPDMAIARWSEIQATRLVPAQPQADCCDRDTEFTRSLMALVLQAAVLTPEAVLNDLLRSDSVFLRTRAIVLSEQLRSGATVRMDASFGHLELDAA